MVNDLLTFLYRNMVEKRSLRSSAFVSISSDLWPHILLLVESRKLRTVTMGISWLTGKDIYYFIPQFRHRRPYSYLWAFAHVMQRYALPTILAGTAIPTFVPCTSSSAICMGCYQLWAQISLCRNLSTSQFISLTLLLAWIRRGRTFIFCLILSQFILRYGTCAISTRYLARPFTSINASLIAMSIDDPWPSETVLAGLSTCSVCI